MNDKNTDADKELTEKILKEVFSDLFNPDNVKTFLDKSTKADFERLEKEFGNKDLDEEENMQLLYKSVFEIAFKSILTEIIENRFPKAISLAIAEKEKEVEEVFNELDRGLVCIDFKRLLTKRDYQIITEFFNKINIARKKIGLKEIEHV